MIEEVKGTYGNTQESKIIPKKLFSCLVSASFRIFDSKAEDLLRKGEEVHVVLKSKKHLSAGICLQARASRDDRWKVSIINFSKECLERRRSATDKAFVLFTSVNQKNR